MGSRRGSRGGRRRGVLTASAALVGVMVGTGMGLDPGGQALASAADGGDFDVADYDIEMSYQPDTRTLEGATVVSATATGELSRFTLHLSGLTVRSVTVGSEPVASFSQTGEKDLVIVPATTIEQGTEFRVRIDYDGTPGDGWMPTTSGGATAFMGDSSSWFPVHEDAHDGADFRLAATVPSGWSAVSIGREQPARQGSATSTFRWTEPDVDPSHIAVSIDRFTIDRSTLADGTPVVNAYAPGLEENTEPLADRLPEIIDFLSGKFGEYPYQAAGNVFVHVGPTAPATSPRTRPVYLGADNTDYMTLDVVVHEQAHQWYGNSVAPEETVDICLSECFATYATWLWDEAKEDADLGARYREQVNDNRGDADFWGELYLPDEQPGMALYDKSPLAMHALRQQIGDEAFHQLIREWAREYRGDYVDWPRFEGFAEDVSGQDLSGFFEAWFRGGTMPSDEYLWPGSLAP